MTLAQLLFTFDGRIGRKAWWFASVVLIAAELSASILDWVLVGRQSGVLSLIVGVVSFVATVAICIKRFHDRDKSGWWLLILFVPLVGFVWILIENGFLRGTEGSNRFGPDPHGPAWLPRA